MSADWLLGVFCRPPGARHSWTASYKYSKKYKDGLQLGDGEQKDQATGGPMRSGLYWENMQGSSAVSSHVRVQHWIKLIWLQKTMQFTW